jgi:hypothetical protein
MLGYCMLTPPPLEPIPLIKSADTLNDVEPSRTFEMRDTRAQDVLEGRTRVPFDHLNRGPLNQNSLQYLKSLPPTSSKPRTNPRITVMTSRRRRLRVAYCSFKRPRPSTCRTSKKTNWKCRSPSSLPFDSREYPVRGDVGPACAGLSSLLSEESMSLGTSFSFGFILEASLLRTPFAVPVMRSRILQNSK